MPFVLVEDSEIIDAALLVCQDVVKLGRDLPSTLSDILPAAEAALKLAGRPVPKARRPTVRGTFEPGYYIRRAKAEGARDGHDKTH